MAATIASAQCADSIAKVDAAVNPTMATIVTATDHHEGAFSARQRGQVSGQIALARSAWASEKTSSEQTAQR